MGGKFEERGYPRKLISRQLDRAKQLERSELLMKKTKSTKLDRIPLVTSFNQTSQYLSRSVRRHWHIMREYYKQIQAFQPILVLSYRRSNSLRDRLVKYDCDPTNPSRPSGRRGCYPCMTCDNCSLRIKGRFLHIQAQELSTKYNTA